MKALEIGFLEWVPSSCYPSSNIQQRSSLSLCFICTVELVRCSFFRMAFFQLSSQNLGGNTFSAKETMLFKHYCTENISKIILQDRSDYFFICKRDKSVLFLGHLPSVILQRVSEASSPSLDRCPSFWS